MICVGCPMGCNMKITCTEEGDFISVSGNTCKRGEEYARTEFTNPQRILTTTVKTEDGRMVSVKTQNTISKKDLFDAMKIIGDIKIELPVKVGDVLIKNVCGSDVIATQSME